MEQISREMSTTHEIRGNTLRVYLHLVKNGPAELRDVQRGTALSTPSLASYHLGRLVTWGYARQDELGRYVATNESSSQILEGYSKVGTAIVPQLLFFAVLFSFLAVFFSFEAFYSQAYIPYLILVAVAMVGVLWFETLRLWRKLVGE